jgi:hypothetical protein
VWDRVRKRCELDTVLGLSMTPTAVGLVLVEGHGADGEIMDQDAFDVPTRRGATAISTSEYVAGAMSRTRAMAHDRRPHAIGVTWSDESELEASLLLKSLTDAGFDNIVAVRSPEAGEALARGIGRAVGYRLTALCLLEPESVVVSMVDTHDDAVHSISYHEDDTNRGLIGWLSGVFDVNDWRPECLIIVGPDAGLTALAKQIEQALGIPVFAPPEAELALARGAALASAQIPELGVGEYGPSGIGHQAGGRSRSLPYTAALTMLVVGVLAFVVSVSLVAGLKLTSSTASGTAPAQAQRQAAKPPAPPVAAQVVVPPAAPPPLRVAPPPPAAPVLPPAPTAIPTVEAPLSPAEEVSSGEPEQAPAPDAAPPPASDPPLAYVPPPPAAPAAKPPLLTRILSHIPGLHQDAPPPANTSPAPDPATPTDAPPPPPPG